MNARLPARAPEERDEWLDRSRQIALQLHEVPAGAQRFSLRSYTQATPQSRNNLVPSSIEGMSDPMPASQQAGAFDRDK